MKKQKTKKKSKATTYVNYKDGYITAASPNGALVMHYNGKGNKALALLNYAYGRGDSAFVKDLRDHIAKFGVWNLRKEKT